MQQKWSRTWGGDFPDKSTLWSIYHPSPPTKTAPMQSMGMSPCTINSKGVTIKKYPPPPKKKKACVCVCVMKQQYKNTLFILKKKIQLSAFDK